METDWRSEVDSDRRRDDREARQPVSDGYRDDPDDIFDLPPQDRRPMSLDTRIGENATARDYLERFDPRRAGQDRDLSTDDAVSYLSHRRRDQPRFGSVAEQEPCVQRVYATLDQGGFHGTIRHEGGVSNEEHLRRVQYREDPAQLDPDKRVRAVDAYRKGNQRHLCPEYSTGIDDPIAYALAVARGVEHPKVREVLDAAPDPAWDEERTRKQIDIAEILGEDGHRYCTGHQLVGEDLKQAAKDRDRYLKAQWRGQQTDVPAPQAERIDSFENGVIEFRFRATDNNSRYKLLSMFPKPFADPPDEELRR